jgi:hypothetical protein
VPVDGDGRAAAAGHGRQGRQAHFSVRTPRLKPTCLGAAVDAIAPKLKPPAIAGTAAAVVLAAVALVAPEEPIVPVAVVDPKVELKVEVSSAFRPVAFENEPAIMTALFYKIECGDDIFGSGYVFLQIDQLPDRFSRLD